MLLGVKLERDFEISRFLEVAKLIVLHLQVDLSDNLLVLVEHGIALDHLDLHLVIVVRQLIRMDVLVELHLLVKYVFVVLLFRGQLDHLLLWLLSSDLLQLQCLLGQLVLLLRQVDFFDLLLHFKLDHFLLLDELIMQQRPSPFRPFFAIHP